MTNEYRLKSKIAFKRTGKEIEKRQSPAYTIVHSALVGTTTTFNLAPVQQTLYSVPIVFTSGNSSCSCNFTVHCQQTTGSFTFPNGTQVVTGSHPVTGGTVVYFWDSSSNPTITNLTP